MFISNVLICNYLEEYSIKMCMSMSLFRSCSGAMSFICLANGHFLFNIVY